MTEKRKRGQNFSMEEKDKLVKLLEQHKETILNKKTDGTTNEAKNKAWIELTSVFNSSGVIYRTKDSLMKLWEKLKTESKLYYQSNKRSVTGTGGGPSTLKVDPVLEHVCSLLGRACTGIIGVQDCDSAIIEELEKQNNPPKILKIMDESDTEAENSQILLEVLDEAEYSKEQKTVSHEICKTPLWSRRRPQLSQTNERTEAINTLCSSFQSVNKKKEDSEELKRQLLEEELQFKRKLHELHLQTAATELDIKVEILKQVRDGAMNLQSLFSAPRSSN